MAKSKKSVKYSNSKGEFTLKNGVLLNSKGERVTSAKVSTNRDPLKPIKEKGK